MKSKITAGETTFLFKGKILNKFEVSFFKCNDTGFIQTEEPYWLQEAYSSAITKLDVGLYQRNETLKDRVEKILLKNFNCDNKFLDYAGGYGLFTRMMRDRGFNFYHTDKFCQNLFAENFELANITGEHFELVTAFEVFEHLTDPVNEIKDLFKFSDNILFSTELQESREYKTVKDWWYFSPETGQHISFFNIQSLTYLASQYGYKFYTDGKSLHLFTKELFNNNLLKVVRDPFVIRKMKKFIKKYEQDEYKFRESLLSADWHFVKDKINSAR